MKQFSQKQNEVLSAMLEDFDVIISMKVCVKITVYIVQNYIQWILWIPKMYGTRTSSNEK